MSVSMKHILNQGPVLAGLGRTIFAGLKNKVLGNDGDLQVPGDVIEDVYDPRPRDLIDDYVEHVGGDPGEYRETLPPHLFPQWGFALAPQTLTDLPYPISRAMNGGCRMEVNEPLPVDEELHVTAQLVDVDDNGSRAVLQQKIVTSTPSVSEGIVAHLFVVIPLGGESTNEAEDEQELDPADRKKRIERVPSDAKEVARWNIPDSAGLDFAKLTGDFNPLHWIPPYAKMGGFPNVILHGFSTMARAYEGLNQEAFQGRRDIDVFDVQFKKPLVLPAEVGLYMDDSNGVFVGDAPSGPCYMSGYYETSQ
ncbi:MAG: MaoC family dehydratase [bacterium]